MAKFIEIRTGYYLNTDHVISFNANYVYTDEPDGRPIALRDTFPLFRAWIDSQRREADRLRG